MWPCASPLWLCIFPLCLLTPPVLRFSCRITLRFDVLGQSLMYLNPLVQLVSDLSKFPRVSLSLPSRALKSSSLLKSQRRFSAAEQVCICLVYEDPPLAFPLLCLPRLAYHFFDRSHFPVHTWSDPYRIDHLLASLHLLYLYLPVSASLLTARSSS